MLQSKEPYINSVNLNANTDFPYLFLDITQDNSSPLTPGFRVPHWHDDLQFIYVTAGSISVQTLDQTIEVHTGEGIFINKNVVHLINPIGRCHRNCYRFPEYLLSFYPGCPVKPLISQISGNHQIPFYIFKPCIEWHHCILSTLQKLTLLEQNKNDFYHYEVMVSLTTLWLEFYKNLVMPISVQQPIKHVRMQIFLQFIKEHYGENLSLNDLAKSANVSKSECLRCFKENLQMTPYRYLVEYRLYQAAMMLRDTDLPIGIIAANVGFEQCSNFAKCFKQKLGSSPRDYRVQIKMVAQDRPLRS